MVALIVANRELVHKRGYNSDDEGIEHSPLIIFDILCTTYDCRKIIRGVLLDKKLSRLAHVALFREDCLQTQNPMYGGSTRRHLVKPR